MAVGAQQWQLSSCYRDHTCQTLMTPSVECDDPLRGSKQRTHCVWEESHPDTDLVHAVEWRQRILLIYHRSIIEGFLKLSTVFSEPRTILSSSPHLQILTDIMVHDQGCNWTPWDWTGIELRWNPPTLGYCPPTRGFRFRFREMYVTYPFPLLSLEANW